MVQPVRRIVTGHNNAGQSCVAMEGHLSPGEIGHDLYLWTSSETPIKLTGKEDAALKPHRLEPPPSGSVFRFVEIPPVSALSGLSRQQVDGIVSELWEKLGASHCQIDTSRSPGMHRTRSLDYVVVLSGELTMILDEGEVILKPRDVVVQRGTNHDWFNHTNEPALLAVVMLDAEPA